MISEAIKPLKLVDQVAEFKFESKFEPLQVIRQSLQRLFQMVIESSGGKINCQALGAALLLCLHGLDWQHKHKEFPSQLQSLLAVTGSLEENMLLLLLY